VLLDVRTLFAAMFAAFLVFGLTLAVSRRSLADCVELGTWTWGAWAMVLAFVLLSLRVVAPEWISIVGGNTLMFVGVHLQSQALHRFVIGDAAPRWQTALVVAGAVLITAMAGQPLSQRTALVSAVLALQGVSMFWVVASRGWHAEPSLRTVAMAVGIGIVSLAARAVHATLDPAQYDDFWQPSLGNGLTYLAGYLFPLCAGFGFIVANLERTSARLRDQATYDGLTGCLRRGAFDPLLANACEHALREGEPLSLVMIDLDHFKIVNDTHGHPAGDQVLKEVARALRARLRRSDVLARMGGEEFALLLPSTTTAGALHIAEQVRDTIARLVVQIDEGPALRVTVSGGVTSLWTDEPRDGRQMVRRADAALYASKHAGRNRMSVAAAPPSA
jgi:diguanylate cyclase (GGDEF)-like protein